MSIKIGDEVRFLNDVGGGIVSAFSGKDQVIVDSEDGFGIPVLIRECVVIVSANTESSAPHPTPSVVKTTIYTSATTTTTRANEPRVKAIESSNTDELNILLAYIPIEGKTTQETTYETYLINESEYTLYFTYLNRQNGSYICRNNTVIEPNTRIFIDHFDREKLNDLEHLCVQIVAFKAHMPFKLKETISVELHLDTVKFYKDNSFKLNSYFDKGALILPIVKSSISQSISQIDPLELQEAIAYKKSADRSNNQPIVKKKDVKSDIIEIDLHINELLDTTAGMSSGEIFQYQIDAFHRIMREHDRSLSKKMVFIHGKGNGVLRKALEKELRTYNKHYTYQDASFCKYGFGALMVIVK